MIERRSYKNCGKNNKMQRKREKQVFLPLPFCVIPVLCPGGSFLLRQPLALCGLCPGRASVSDSILAHREFESGGADCPRTHPVRSNSPGLRRAQTSPGQNAGQAAAFANSPSLASRLTQGAHRTAAGQRQTRAAAKKQPPGTKNAEM